MLETPAAPVRTDDAPSRNLESNLKALSLRDPALAERLAPPCALTDGRPLAVIPAAAGRWTIAMQSGTALPGLADLPAADRRAKIMAEKLLTARSGVALVDDPGMLCARELAVGQLVGSSAPILAMPIFTELAALRASLQLFDVSELLSEERIVPFGGDSAWEDFVRRLRTQPELPVPDLAAFGPSVPAQVRSAANSLLEGLWRETNNEIEKLTGELEAYWAAEPWREAFAGRRRLRLQTLCSVRSTFVQYSIQDLISAESEADVETRLIRAETTIGRRITPLAWLREVAAFRPDAFLWIDHVRAECGWMPKNLPVVTWIQDTLPHLCSQAVGRNIGPRDFVMGWGKTEMCELYGYPRERFLPSGIPTNPRRFEAPRAYAGRRFECDLSYVSHYSAMPEAAVAEFVGLGVRSEANRRTMAEFHRCVVTELKGNFLRTPRELEEFFAAFLRGRSIPWDDVDRRDDLLRSYWNGPFNHAYRQQVLSWVVDLAQAEGLRLAIYGRGWEQNPRFAPYARGVADNRRDLGRIAVESRINLQISFHTAVHQRVLDGLAAGGLFLMFDAREEVSPVWAGFREALRRELGADARLPSDFLDRLPRERRKEIEAVWADRCAKHGRLDMRLALQTYLESADTDDLACAFSGAEVNEICFRNSDELRQRWERFSAHPDQAQALLDRMRGAVLQKHTYGALLGRLRGFLRRSLGVGDGGAPLAPDIAADNG